MPLNKENNFPTGICKKVNVIERLEFEFAKVYLVNHNAMCILSSLINRWLFYF